MVLSTVTSKNGIKIRLTDERWYHITKTHPEINPEDFSIVTNTVENPEIILEGDVGELLAVKKHGNRTWIVVPYKEVDDKDGFILTAYQTTDNLWLFKRKILWNKV